MPHPLTKPLPLASRSRLPNRIICLPRLIIQKLPRLFTKPLVLSLPISIFVVVRVLTIRLVAIRLNRQPQHHRLASLAFAFRFPPRLRTRILRNPIRRSLVRKFIIAQLDQIFDLAKERLAGRLLRRRLLLELRAEGKFRLCDGFGGTFETDAGGAGGCG